MSTRPSLAGSQGGTGWPALGPTGVACHKRFARDTPPANLFRLRHPGRVQSDSTGATPPKSSTTLEVLFANSYPSRLSFEIRPVETHSAT